MQEKRILIIDDEANMRRIYCQMIRESGIEVLEASDAWEATDILIKEQIDLILLDIKLPEVDGKQLFEVISEQAPEIKIIVISVYSEDQQRQILPGARYFFDKALGSYQLVERIKNVLF